LRTPAAPVPSRCSTLSLRTVDVLAVERTVEVIEALDAWRENSKARLPTGMMMLPKTWFLVPPNPASVASSWIAATPAAGE
jgi:hypothetical protein